MFLLNKKFVGHLGVHGPYWASWIYASAELAALVWWDGARCCYSDIMTAVVTYRVVGDDGRVQCGEGVIADPRHGAQYVRRKEMIM